MKKSMKRILCGVLSLGLCATVATETALRSAKGEYLLGTTTANASFKNVTGMYDTSAMREANFNDSVLKTEDVAPTYETRTVLVTLSGEPLVERADDTSVESYMTSFSGEVAKSEISKEQTNFLQSLKKMGIPYKLEHAYNAVLNGVAVELDTQYVSKIKKMSGVDSVVITTAYALPEAADGEGSGVVTNQTTVRATGIYDSDAYTSAYGNGAKNYGTGMVVAVLDTGLDYTHDAFQSFQHALSDEDIAWSRAEVAARMNAAELTAEQRSGSLDVSDVYVSAKVPFAYDYADDDADVYPSYSNHGTHVAGIIGGYDPSGYTDKDGNPIDETFLGVVPDAQLMICKVFTDDLDDKDLGGAVSADIVAALDDCVKMNVDVINMSLGSSCGFTTTDDGDDEGDMLNEVYERIGEAGITLVCAASNDYSAGYGGVYGTNLKTNPDAGTVGSPSTYASALSVASINGQKASYMIANDETYVFFEEARDINSNPMEFVKSMTTDERYKKHGTPTADGGYEFEYVVIPGVGEGKDYSSKTASLLKEGRIALIKRGDSSFEEKVRLAQSMGAIGVIIYNNVAGSIRMNLGEIEDPVPAVSTSMNAGNAMVSAAKATNNVGKIVLHTDYAAGPFMSEFSSWGPTPDLRIKPEITAHGGEITSAVPGGYGEQSGTSMASPNMAGFMAVVRSYIKQELPHLVQGEGGKIDNVKLNNLAMQLTMSTAGVVYDQDGLPYSPRKQGAGVARMENVVGGTSAYLFTDDDSTEYNNASKDGRPKIELGDMLHEKNIEFTFYLHNFGAQALNFDLKATLMTETLSSDELTVVEQAHLLNNGSTVKFYVDGSETTSLSVPAGTQKQAVTVKISLGDKDKQYIEDCFANGMYVEGFVTLASKTSGQCDMNLPFMGFYGDWEQAPMLDYSAYQVAENAQDSSILEEDKIKASVWATQPYNIYYNDKYVLPMGGYLYLLPDDADEMYVDEEHNAVSRYNDYYGEGNVENYMTTTGIKAVYAGLLRNAREVRYTLTDEATGEVLIADTIHRVAKAYAGGGSAVPANVKLEIYPEEWGFIANGKYRMDFEFIREKEEDMPEDANNTFSFSFTVDYEAPVLQEARVRIENYKDGNKQKRKVHLDLDVYDNHYAQTLMLCYPKTKANGDVVVQLLTDYPTPVRNAVKNGVTTVSVDITDIYEKYGNTLYLQIDDYALNTCLYQLDINQAHANSIPDGQGFTLLTDDKLTGGKSNTYSLQLNQYEMYKPTVSFGADYKGDADTVNLLWKSNNSNIVKVQNGELVGVGKGKTKVIVNNRKGEQKEIEVTVSDVQASGLSKIPAIEFGIIQTESDAWTKATGDVEVAAGKDLELNILTDPWYHPMTDLNIRWESLNESVATITHEYGKTATIHTLKKGTVQIRATVQTKDSNGEWKDSQYKVGVTLRVQKEFTVSNFTLNDYNGLGYNEENGILRIPTDMNIMYIGENAFEDNNTIRKIIIPSSVVEIRPRAFKNCTALEEVYFVETTAQPIADADVSMIYENAFEGCDNLKLVDFSNVKTVTIAQDCFSGCSKLEEVKGMPKIGTMHHRAFAGTALTSVDLSGLHMSGEEVFANCKNLTQITATSKFSAIGKYMFSGCTSLAGTVTLETPKVGEGAFSGCTALEKVVFTSDVKELDIGARAFERCGVNADEDFSVEFQAGCTARAIGEKAFVGSTLASFDFSKVNGLELLGENAFENTKMTAVTLADTLVGVNGDVYTYLRSTGIPFEGLTVNVAQGSQYFAEDNGAIYDKDYKTILYVNGSVTGAYTVKTGVTAIADYAFAASNVSSLQLNADVTSIGVGAFKNATLTAFDFNGNTNVTELPAYAFAGSHLKSFALPATIEKIGEYAFAGSDLMSFTVAANSSLTSVGSYAFSACNALESIDLSSLTLADGQTRKMGEGVFYNCASLKSVQLPSVTEMGDGALLGASKLESVVFGANSTTTGNYTVSGTPVTAVTLPQSIEAIGEGAFYGCDKLESIVLPASCVTVSDYAFSGCTALTAATGIDGVQTFGNSAFYQTALPTLTLTAAEAIGDMAFAQYDTAAEEVKWTSVTFGGNLATIGDFAFYNNGATEITLPAGVQSVGAAAFASSDKLETILVEKSDTASFFDEDGVVYRKAGAEGQYELIAYPTARQQAEDGNQERTYTVKEGAVRIQAYAFAYLNEGMVERVVLPYTVNAIGDSAFFVSDIAQYTFESIVAPTLETSYRAEVREAVGADEAIAAYKGYYYTNFQTYLYHFTQYGGQKSPLTINYPSNGKGYTNPIYSMYFGTRNPSATPMQEDNTRALLKLVEAMPSAESVASWTTSTTNKAAVEEFAATMKLARTYYNNAIKYAGQKGYVTQAVESKLLAVEAALRTVKKNFGIPVYARQLLIAENSTHKTQYVVGDTFDMTGLSIIIEYDDYSTEAANASDLSLVTTGELADYMETVDVLHTPSNLRLRIPITVAESAPSTTPDVSAEKRGGKGCSCNSSVGGNGIAFTAVAIAVLAVIVCCMRIVRKKQDETRCEAVEEPKTETQTVAGKQESEELRIAKAIIDDLVKQQQKKAATWNSQIDKK